MTSQDNTINALVLSQYRDEANSEYNDFLGKYYHFPQKYLGLISNSRGAEFIYYEPKKRGAGVYFGFGKLGLEIHSDKQHPGFHYIEIKDYRPFSEDVPFADKLGATREPLLRINAQMAVREIPQKTLEEICLDGGVQLRFRADAHLMTVIGEQLIASEKVGILELIKNAYDAGASYCRVRVEKIPTMLPLNAEKYRFPNLEGPVILIEDDGKGMDRETIENGWLRPASPLKTSIKERIKRERERALIKGNLAVFDSLIDALRFEHGGRIPLGEKGIGRFAAHRLGTKLVLTTKVPHLDYEFVLKIDWDQFDKVGDKQFIDLDSIGIALTRQTPSRDYGYRNSGTQLLIYGGREGYQLTMDNVLDIERTVKTLKSPFKESAPSNFNVLFECPQIIEPEEDNLLERYPATFIIEGTVDSNGKFLYDLNFNPPATVSLLPENKRNEIYDLRKSEKDKWKKPGTDDFRTPECGEFFIRILAWIRKPPWISGPDWQSFQKYLEKYGGISIFRDGMMILPAEWGAETDWLELSKRQIKQVFHISYYNLVGNVELNQARNVLLIDKSDREGLLQTRAFEDLKLLVKAVVTNILEPTFDGKRRMFESVREKQGKPLAIDHTGTEITEVSTIIEKIAKRYDIKNDPFQILETSRNADDWQARLPELIDVLKRLHETINLMQQVQDLLTEQAGYGIAIGVAVHEIEKITSNFYYSVKTMLDSGKIDNSKLEELKEASLAIKSELNRLGPQRAIRNERPYVFDIRRSLEFERDVYTRRLETLGIDLKLEYGQGFDIYARYGAVNQILSNLIDNSVYWLDTEPLGDRKIVIVVNPLLRNIRFADSGPGVHSSIRPFLFQPGYSMKSPPSGLGLYICRYYMTSMGGDIFETPNSEKISTMKGAQFTLDFSKVPKDPAEARK